MELPQGIQTKHGNSIEHVLKLEKNIYGQKQAGRMWNSFLVDKLTSIGFTTLLIDDCVFFLADIIFMVYVDDGILIGSNNTTKFHPVWSTFVPGSPKNNILSVVPYSMLKLVCKSSKKNLIYRH
jgi:hypothetical protein